VDLTLTRRAAAADAVVSTIVFSHHANDDPIMQVRKRHFLRHFILKMIILPRQARDKHRESTQKRDVMNAADAEDGRLLRACPASAREDWSA
jgi:hypothetical protein